MTQRISIIGGSHSCDTKIFIDDVIQSRLTDVRVILEVGEPNRVIFTYAGVDVDIVFDGMVISTPEKEDEEDVL